jgi:hypothetical protein
LNFQSIPTGKQRKQFAVCRFSVAIVLSFAFQNPLFINNLLLTFSAKLSRLALGTPLAKPCLTANLPKK